MSFYIDKSYILQITSRLPRFKAKSDKDFVCRCPFCGDSKKSKTKARGTFYRYKDSLMYKCFNCGISLNTGQVLERIDTEIYKKYLFERFNYSNEHRWANRKSEIAEEIVKKKQKETSDNPCKKYLRTIESLPNDHPAKIFLAKRRIPSKHWSNLYYTTNYMKFINKYCDNKKFVEESKLDNRDPRIVIPFFDKEGNEFAWQGRTIIVGKEPRYITIKSPNHEGPIVYGLERVDESKTIYVTEGPLDSLFIPNCLAAAGANLGKVEGVHIFDNEPRNVDICKIMQKIINENKEILIFPSHLTEKDINDMILGGMKKIELYKILRERVYSGLEAQLEFDKWKRCNV